MRNKMNDLMDAQRLGAACRVKSMEYKNTCFLNPFALGTKERTAWDAGYKNDLEMWMMVFKGNATKRPNKPLPLGRLRPHDSIVFNAHTSKPDRGEFLGYNQSPEGFCRVLLDRGGFTTVPVKSLTRPVRATA